MNPEANVKRSEGLAIAGMVVGICSLVLAFPLGFPLGVTAIILSVIALKKQQGKGMALAGLITGAVGLLLGCLFVLLLIFSITSYNGVTQRAIDQQEQQQRLKDEQQRSLREEW